MHKHLSTSKYPPEMNKFLHFCLLAIFVEKTYALVPNVVHQHYILNITKFKNSISKTENDIEKRVAYSYKHLGKPAKTVKLTGVDVRIIFVPFKLGVKVSKFRKASYDVIRSSKK